MAQTAVSEKHVLRLTRAPISQGVQEIISLVDDPRTSVAKLTSVIRKNQVLMDRVLRQANSPLYGFPHRISDPNFAVILLGFDALKEMIVRSIVTGAFGRMVNSVVRFEEFWSHSVGCGLGARLIAERTGLCDPTDAFVAGLLHDVGYIILNGSLADRSGELVQTRVGGQPATQTPTLRENHAAVGAWLTERWNVSAGIVEAIRCHHEPATAVVDRGLTAIVHISEVMCHQLSIGKPDYETVDGYDVRALKTTGLTEAALAAHSSKGYVALFKENMSRAPKFEELVNELRRHLIEAVEDLSEKERLVVALLYYEGLSIIDIAKVLELPVPDIEQFQATALARLRAAITLMV